MSYCIREPTRSGKGNLASILDQETNDFLVSLTQHSPDPRSWIGASDAEAEGDWTWSDGSPWGNYTNWLHEEANNEGNRQHHAMFNARYWIVPGKWEDRASSPGDWSIDGHGFICQSTIY